LRAVRAVKPRLMATISARASRMRFAGVQTTFDVDYESSPSADAWSRGPVCPKLNICWSRTGQGCGCSKEPGCWTGVVRRARRRTKVEGESDSLSAAPRKQALGEAFLFLASLPPQSQLWSLQYLPVDLGPDIGYSAP